MSDTLSNSVIPAKAGISINGANGLPHEIPASAGMTNGAWMTEVSHG